ncbi:hypothetical protein [Tautonia sociabilis]|uniref:Uncharacterized protein n=1 Tax=Tautonia sociabilis TaxID=2080755 RepID=A0A432MMM2_9BACT|nr:hypothetical protein [Tautonia sociabilis]RUL88489.1 hypothetical protein TsocGM_07185 [Tautonia sociabilis]
MPTRDDLFDEDEQSPPAGTILSRPAKPFAQYLQETPAKPLSQGVRFALWAAGGLTALLFLASVLKVAG